MASDERRGQRGASRGAAPNAFVGAQPACGARFGTLPRKISGRGFAP